MSLPVISVAQMREWEQASWTAGKSEADVIRQVGQCVAQRALGLAASGARILILAGKGHNGDDARHAAENLPDREVELLNVSDPAADLAKLETALALNPDLIIDGLFGIGLDRPLSDEWVRFIERVNASGIPVLAVDVPSGLDAQTGAARGAAIRAAVTLTVGAPKAGMLASTSWPYVGKLDVTGDIGLVPCPLTSESNWTLPEDFRRFPRARMVAGHKGTYGKLAIVAGSPGFHGAAVLAARGAQRAQPGLIEVQTMEDTYYPVASQFQSVMVSVWVPVVKWTGDHSAVLVGPGLAAPNLPDPVKTFTRHLWRDSAVPVVVDASALDWLPQAAVIRNALRVITPHPGEAARLLRCSTQQVQDNRFEALRQLSRRFGNAWVVLKGHQTLIGRHEGPVYVNCSGNPHLAQGGSGDVLSGYIAGLLAQPALREDPVTAIRYAVWRHGAAADELQARGGGWTVENLVEQLGR